jgi:SOS-response transcriptional repressor LexA
MSWQATAWAVRQKTGAASRKALLLVLANYADEHGVCWPSQETLKAETELSEDTIQRQSKILKKLGLVKIIRRPRKAGTWSGLLHQLNLSEETSTMPQGAARSEGENLTTMPHPAGDHAALTTSTIPQSLRHKPSYLEPLNKPSSRKRRKPVEERLQAFQRKQVGNEVFQNRIAQRLGKDGWVILQQIGEAELGQLTAMERNGRLDDSIIARLRMRIARQPARGVIEAADRLLEKVRSIDVGPEG